MKHATQRRRDEEHCDKLASLKECLQRLGGSESGVKKAVGEVLGVAAGFYSKVRSDETASRALRDDFGALCCGTVCEMLHTTALAMKDDRTADLALRSLKDFLPLIMAISRAMPGVLLHELSEGAPGQVAEATAQAEARGPTPASCLAGEIATGGGVVASDTDGAVVNVRSTRPQADTPGAPATP